MNKKCYNIQTWKEEKLVALRLDESSLFFLEGTYDIAQSIPSDPTLAEICNATGAKMYGDYVVYSDENCIFKYYTRKDRSEWFESIWRKNLIYSSIRFYEAELYIDPFFEYSKSLCYEANQLEKVKYLLNL